MPIYEYQCSKCNAVTERLQGVNDAPLGKCPSCGGKVRKMMSSGAFVLKGSGFYATDYARKGNGKANGKDASSAPSCPAAGGEASAACAGCPKAE